MIQRGTANLRCLNCKDIVNLEVVLRNVKQRYAIKDMSLVWYIKAASKFSTFIPTESQSTPTSYPDYPAQALLYWLHYYDKIPGFTALWLPVLGAQVDRILETVSEDNEFSVFLSPEQKWAQLFTTRQLSEKWSRTQIAGDAANYH